MVSPSLIDVTIPLTAQIPVFPGESGPVLSPVARIADGEAYNVSAISLGLHTGTHVDAPRHFIEGGAGVEALAFDSLCGPARVVRIDDPVSIRAEHVDQLGPVDRVLFQTRNGALWERPDFQESFVYLALDAAQLLIQRGVQLVGIDYLSMEAFDTKDYAVHHALLDAGVVIVEGLDLRRVTPGDYTLWCLPLKVVGADGAPCRAVLERRESE
jgi:arylformamidase